jgi:hypothetical protein
MSNAPDREDRPASSEDAKARFDAYLQQLADTAPRAGLGAATGDFIDDLIRRAGRYGNHLFLCFDDARIPATTNELEGFFGGTKHTVRHANGTGSTTNSVMSNLGADAVIVHQFIRQPQVRARLREPAASPDDFQSARARVAQLEAPAIRQRSYVRNLKRHLDRLRQRWFGKEPAGP